MRGVGTRKRTDPAMAADRHQRMKDLSVLSKVEDLSEQERIQVVMALVEGGLNYGDIFVPAPNLLERARSKPRLQLQTF